MMVIFPLPASSEQCMLGALLLRPIVHSNTHHPTPIPAIPTNRTRQDPWVTYSVNTLPPSLLASLLASLLFSRRALPSFFLSLFSRVSPFAKSKLASDSPLNDFPPGNLLSSFSLLSLLPLFFLPSPNPHPLSSLYPFLFLHLYILSKWLTVTLFRRRSRSSACR